MANVVLTVLSMTIGFFFLFMGTLKLSPIISEEAYREMRKVFIRCIKVFPLVELTGWKPEPHMLRKVVGSTEVLCGVILALIPGSLKQIANLILLGLMFCAIYTHYALKDGLEKMTPALVFGLLLTCRFVVYLQVRAREAKQLRVPAPQHKTTIDKKTH